MIEHQYVKTMRWKRRMETVDDVAMGVRIGMGAKEWKPATWEDMPKPKSDAAPTATKKQWPGQAVVSFGEKGISVR